MRVLRAMWNWLARRRAVTALSIGLVVGLAIGLLTSWDDPDPFPPGELVILSGLDESADGQRQQLIDQWNELHPEHRATIEELPGVTDAQRGEMVSRAQSGGGGVDIYNLDVTWTAEFAEQGWIVPLDGVDTSGFLRKPLETGRYLGQQWALPFNTDVGLLFYRTDLVDPPLATWARLRSTIEDVFARPPAPPLVAGYTGQLAPYEGLTVNALEAVQAVAGGAVVRDKRVIVDQADLQAGVERLRPTADGAPYVLPDSLGFFEAQSTQAFREGKVLFMRNWPVAYRTLAQQAEANGPQLQFGVTPLPGPSVLGGQNLAISSSSDHKAAARALIEYLTDPRSQQILFERGGLAATREIVYQDEVVRRQHPYAEVLLEAVEDAEPRPVTPCYPAFSELFWSTVDRALRADESLPADFKDRLEAVLSDC